jgi:hypothetical protein
MVRAMKELHERHPKEGFRGNCVTLGDLKKSGDSLFRLLSKQGGGPHFRAQSSQPSASFSRVLIFAYSPIGGQYFRAIA